MGSFCLFLGLTSSKAEARVFKLIAYGDSLTAGYQLPQREAFPAKLEGALKKLGYDLSVENAGVSGDTASQGLARLDWSLQTGADALLLELGANDALRGLDPAITEAALDQIISRCQQRGIAVFLIGMKSPPNNGEVYQQVFDQLYPRLANKYGLMLYPFFLDGVVGNPAFLLADGMHPNAAGVDVMVMRILPFVVEFVEKLRASRP